MKNVLIPTDFSENSRNAIRYALEYFAEVPTSFFFLHVSTNYQPFNNAEVENPAGRENALMDLNNPLKFLLNEIKVYKESSTNLQHRFTALEENSLLVEAIRRHILEQEIDIIFMGTKGDSRSNNDEIGSNTYDVITKVKCPIMVIPEEARFNGIRNIAFVTDYNSIYRNRVINTLSQALNLHKSPLRVLHIRPQNNKLNVAQTDNKGFLHYFFKDTRHSFHFLENKNIESGIQEFVDTWEISVVALVAKNLNFIQRLMLRPSTGGFNYHTQIPFLVLHE